MLALLLNFQYVNQCSLNILLFRKEMGGNTIVKNVTVFVQVIYHMLFQGLEKFV